MSSELTSKRIVFYDGICGLCHQLVQWLLQRDPRARLHFAPLQGSTAEEMRRRHPSFPDSLETLVFIDESSAAPVTLRSDAALAIAQHLRGPWPLLRHLRWMPRGLRDAVYRLIARWRYRLRPPLRECPLPDPGTESRFLP